MIKNEKVTIGGWHNYPIIYFFKQIKGCRKFAKFCLNCVGLRDLRLSFALPRSSIAFIGRQCNGKELIGVEVGTQEGINAESMLKTLNIKKLYLVDPFIPYTDKNMEKEEEVYLFKSKIVTELDKILVLPESSHSEENLINFEKEAKKRLKSYNSVEFIKKMSDDALDDIPNKIDFVYIDGNHSYENVKRDLNNYYAKLKKGGYLCGHDCFFPNLGVQKAVLEFAANKTFIHFGVDDWLIIKC